jgi:hypothetical protein
MGPRIQTSHVTMKHDDYMIGCISALSIEMAVAVAVAVGMPDERHDSLA